MKNLKDNFLLIIRWMKDNWLKILIILVVAGAFYWYEWRPSHIKKNCNKQAIEKARCEYDSNPKCAEKGRYTLEAYTHYYERCRHEKGL